MPHKKRKIGEPANANPPIFAAIFDFFTAKFAKIALSQSPTRKLFAVCWLAAKVDVFEAKLLYVLNCSHMSHNVAN